MAKEMQERPQVCVRFSPLVMSQIREYATANGMTVATAIRQAWMRFFRQQQEKK
jgi:hypothetical protein